MTDKTNTGAGRRSDLDEIVKTALAVGHTYAEAGAASGQSERTVRRRMSDPEFAAAVSTRRGEHVGALTGQLMAAGTEAVAVLRGCLASDNEAVRLRAAQLTLAIGTQLRHAHELEVRLAALEAGTVSDCEPTT